MAIGGVAPLPSVKTQPLPKTPTAVSNMTSGYTTNQAPGGGTPYTSALAAAGQQSYAPGSYIAPGPDGLSPLQVPQQSSYRAPWWQVAMSPISAIPSVGQWINKQLDSVGRSVALQAGVDPNSDLSYGGPGGNSGQWGITYPGLTGMQLGGDRANEMATGAGPNLTAAQQQQMLAAQRADALAQSWKDYQATSLGLDINTANSQYGFDQANLQAQHDFGLQQLALDEANARKSGNAALGSLQSRIAALGLDNQLIGQQRGFADQSLSQSQARALAALNTNIADRQAQATPQGTGNLFGSGFARNVGEYRTARDQQDAAAQLSHDSTFASLGNREAQNELEAAQKQKEIAAQNTYLDNLAAQYGLKRSELEQGLSSGMSNLGLKHDSTLAQLQAAQAQTGGAAAGQHEAAIQKILAAGTSRNQVA